MAEPNGAVAPPDAAKPALKGTGVFMPMVGRSSLDRPCPPRSKPSRRRNVSTGSLGPQEQHHAPPRPSLSSRELGQRHFGRDAPFTSINRIEEDSGLEYSSAADVHALHAAANLTAGSAFAAANHHPHDAAAALARSAAGGLRTQQEQLLRLAQSASLSSSLSGLLHVDSGSPRVSSMPAPGAPAGSPAMADLSGLSGLLQPPAVRVSPQPAAAGADAAAPASHPINSDVLQTFFGSGPASNGRLQASFFGPEASTVPTGRLSCDAPQGAAVPDLSAAGSSMGLASLPPRGSLQSPLPSPRALAAGGGPPAQIIGQPSFSKWAVGGMAGPGGQAGPGDDPLEDHEDQIQKRIDELVMMKQLLQLKHQHKQQQDMLQQQQREQQQLLQMQQIQQEQLLQQQLLHVQRSEGSASSSQGVQSMTNLQQELLSQQQQILQVQRSDSSSGCNTMQALQQEFLAQHQQHQQLLQVQRSEHSGSSLSRGGQGQQMAQLQRDLLMQLQQAGPGGAPGTTAHSSTPPGILPPVPSAGNLCGLLASGPQQPVGMLAGGSAAGGGNRLGLLASTGAAGMSGFAAGSNSCDLPLTPALQEGLTTSANLVFAGSNNLGGLPAGMASMGTAAGPWSGACLSSGNNSFLFDNSLMAQQSDGAGKPRRASLDYSGHQPAQRRASFEVNSRSGAPLDFSGWEQGGINGHQI